MDEVLKVSRVGDHVLLVKINRPEKRNAINGEIAQGIGRAVALAEQDSQIRAVVLSSTGDQSFCAGADLAEVAAGNHAALLTKEGGFAGIIEARRTKPWIVAVDAPAFGGGVEICLACDLLVASEVASFALPEVKRGIYAGGGGVFRLPRRIPPAIAYEMLLIGDAISAKRGYELGLVNRLVAAGQAEAQALKMAEQIAEGAPIAVQQSLRVARLAGDPDESALFVAMREAGKLVRESADAKEGTRAFLERRKPVWTGS
ncbi:enoyl-CoA hydratase-related protein [Pseudomonas sp. PDM09]|uniref:enoyl-CoA hydratase-related protein n=1 Tax=Pseudomonas sp. PDM09 TaxID=2769270 RepID=UPI00298C13D0|nr:enoyl-CoA hydratase-related protein [Pseudomonas sp. PDM09]